MQYPLSLLLAGKKRSYGRLGVALLAVLLLAGLTANRYVASDNLRAGVVITRVTGSSAIAALPPDELLTATCPCKVCSKQFCVQREMQYEGR